MNARKRSRTDSSLSFTPPFLRRTNNNHNNNNDDDRNRNDPPRLLRLNVGGHPYDVLRTSLPLLETMMTDRWLDACLYDGDGRIFLDRDGQVFGDILRCLRSPDFLRGLTRRRGGEDGGGVDRLRRLRSEADYYGLQDSLVRMIDDVTIGQRVVLEGGCWARVAGGCLARVAEGVPANGGELNGERNHVGNEILDDDEEENNENVMDQGDENEDGDDDDNEVRHEEHMQEEEVADEQNGDGDAAQELEEEDENNEEVDDDEVDEEVSIQIIHLQSPLVRFDLLIKLPLCHSAPSFNRNNSIS